jgi:hypothetical protein
MSDRTKWIDLINTRLKKKSALAYAIGVDPSVITTFTNGGQMSPRTEALVIRAVAKIIEYADKSLPIQANLSDGAALREAIFQMERSSTFVVELSPRNYLMYVHPRTGEVVSTPAVPFAEKFCPSIAEAICEDLRERFPYVCPTRAPFSCDVSVPELNENVRDNFTYRRAMGLPEPSDNSAVEINAQE